MNSPHLHYLDSIILSSQMYHLYWTARFSWCVSILRPMMIQTEMGEKELIVSIQNVRKLLIDHLIVAGFDLPYCFPQMKLIGSHPMTLNW